VHGKMNARKSSFSTRLIATEGQFISNEMVKKKYAGKVILLIEIY
jgi:hypothetical protein